MTAPSDIASTDQANSVSGKYPDETYYVDGHRVGCNGGGGSLGHPLVYLELGTAGKAVCGYCGRVFLHKSHAEGYADPSPRPEEGH